MKYTCRPLETPMALLYVCVVVSSGDFQTAQLKDSKISGMSYMAPAVLPLSHLHTLTHTSTHTHKHLHEKNRVQHTHTCAHTCMCILTPTHTHKRSLPPPPLSLSLSLSPSLSPSLTELYRDDPDRFPLYHTSDIPKEERCFYFCSISSKGLSESQQNFSLCPRQLCCTHTTGIFDCVRFCKLLC